tara:strand:- start:429 stop:1322 length:894 start_codon:yes stop_codon:yes gene_type:complete
MTNEDKRVKKRKHTGTGVLVITNVNNKPHIVLGRDTFKSLFLQDNITIGMYEEFGGGIQKRSLSLESNACFELREETSNLFNFTDPKILRKGINQYFDIPYKNDRMYRIYVVYLEDIEKIIHYFKYNKDAITHNHSNYYKYKCFLEMDDIQFISLDTIKNNIKDESNYLRLKPDDIKNIRNNNAKLENKSKVNYNGVLKINSTMFLSKRLLVFLNTKFPRQWKEGYFQNIDENHTDPETMASGLDYCYQIFEDGFIKSRFKKNKGCDDIIILTNPRKNIPGMDKLTFLNGTLSIDGY